MPLYVRNTKATEIYQFFQKYNHDQIRELLKEVVTVCKKTKIAKTSFTNALIRLARGKFGKEIQGGLDIIDTSTIPRACVTLELMSLNLHNILMEKLFALRGEKNNLVEFEFTNGHYVIQFKDGMSHKTHTSSGQNIENSSATSKAAATSGLRQKRKADEILAAEALVSAETFVSTNKRSKPNDIWERNPLLSAGDQGTPSTGPVFIEPPLQVVVKSLSFFDILKGENKQNDPNVATGLTLSGLTL